MGWCFMISACFGCGRIFNYNPVRVPSITIRGQRQPICAACVQRVNPMRKANGLDEIVPAPDAYNVVNESELPDD